MNSMQSTLQYRVKLIREMDAASLLPELRVGELITENMQELIEWEKTTHSRNGKLLDTLAKRGPTAKARLIAAMRNTMQDHLANLIEYGNEYGGSVAAPVLAPVSSVFRGFITTVSRLKPIEKQSERCEQSFITSVATYSNAFPKSELSVREIPFVMAIKLGSYAEADVLSWPNAPGKAEYDRQAAIYERETAELMELLRVLEDGGIHLVVKPRDERIYKLVETLRKPFIGVYGRAIHLMLSLVQIKHLSQTDINAITCLVHLMCFDNVNFVIRKTAVPKPNSYLLYNAGALINSTIVMDRDRQWLRDAATTDESVVIVGQTGTVCPW
jgi:hypothetical protein